MLTSNNGFPRAIRRDLHHFAERQISDAHDTVEALGAHPLLTDAVILLSDAQRKVAEWVDLQLADAASPARTEPGEPTE